MRAGLVFAFAAVAACGGRSDLYPLTGAVVTYSIDGGSSSSSSWGQPDSAAPWSPFCPDSAPSAGSTCSSEGVYCEYGEAWWDVSCDDVLRCIGGSWQTAAVSEQTCFPAPGPNAPSCPSSPLTIPAGAACAAPGTACYYGQGAVCTCSIPAGLDAPDAGPSWACGPDPGCPSSRPRLGAACSAGPICEYDDASGFAEVCQGGAWSPGLVGN